MPPRQIEFAKMYLTNVVTGKRYIKKLVEDGIVDGRMTQDWLRLLLLEEEDIRLLPFASLWNFVVFPNQTVL